MLYPNCHFKSINYQKPPKFWILSKRFEYFIIRAYLYEFPNAIHLIIYLITNRLFYHKNQAQGGKIPYNGDR